jgi:hypothetical protein
VTTSFLDDDEGVIIEKSISSEEVRFIVSWSYCVCFSDIVNSTKIVNRITDTQTVQVLCHIPQLDGGYS